MSGNKPATKGSPDEKTLCELLGVEGSRDRGKTVPALNRLQAVFDMLARRGLQVDRALQLLYEVEGARSEVVALLNTMVLRRFLAIQTGKLCGQFSFIEIHKPPEIRIDSEKKEAGVYVSADFWVSWLPVDSRQGNTVVDLQLSREENGWWAVRIKQANLMFRFQEGGKEVFVIRDAEPNCAKQWRPELDIRAYAGLLRKHFGVPVPPAVTEEEVFGWPPICLTEDWPVMPYADLL